MVLYFIFILVAISPVSLNEDKIDYPSFRSSVITNGKPILRGGGPEPEEENDQTSTVPNDTENKEPAISLARPKIDEENNSNLDQTELRQLNSNTTDNRSKMVDDVTTLINWLIEKYNYKIVSPSARRENTDDLTSTGKGVLRSHSNRNKKKSKSRSFKKNKHTSSQKKKKLDFSNGHFRSRSKDDKHLSKKLSRITLPNDQYRGLIRNRRLMATPEEVQAEAFRIRKALRKQKLRTRKVQNQFKQGERQRMEMYGHEDDFTPQRRANSLDKPKRIARTAVSSEEEDEPTWKGDLKDFMKEVINTVSRSSMDRYSRPVIRAVEKKNNVTVADIDVDRLGHIMIDYIDPLRKNGIGKLYRDKGKIIIRDEELKRTDRNTSIFV